MAGQVATGIAGAMLRMKTTRACRVTAMHDAAQPCALPNEPEASEHPMAAHGAIAKNRTAGPAGMCAIGTLKALARREMTLIEADGRKDDETHHESLAGGAVKSPDVSRLGGCFSGPSCPWPF
jgi:hypothetical protein